MANLLDKSESSIQELVTLAQTCSNASPGFPERAAGALWGSDCQFLKLIVDH
ncbi:hypothetical protein SESBI_12587 [Sesbania bispinosa]|nr:hypothetical protein SESBI_12587 [Sesbania bispinosa]